MLFATTKMDFLPTASRPSTYMITNSASRWVFRTHVLRKLRGTVIFSYATPHSMTANCLIASASVGPLFPSTGNLLDKSRRLHTLSFTEAEASFTTCLAGLPRSPFTFGDKDIPTATFTLPFGGLFGISHQEQILRINLLNTMHPPRATLQHFEEYCQ